MCSYVEYELVLPDGWIWSPGDAMKRLTSCSHLAQGIDPCHYISSILIVFVPLTR